MTADDVWHRALDARYDAAVPDDAFLIGVVEARFAADPSAFAAV